MSIHPNIHPEDHRYIAKLEAENKSSKHLIIKTKSQIEKLDVLVQNIFVREQEHFKQDKFHAVEIALKGDRFVYQIAGDERQKEISIKELVPVQNVPLSITSIKSKATTTIESIKKDFSYHWNKLVMAHAYHPVIVFSGLIILWALIIAPLIALYRASNDYERHVHAIPGQIEALASTAELLSFKSYLNALQTSLELINQAPQEQSDKEKEIIHQLQKCLEIGQKVEKCNQDNSPLTHVVAECQKIILEASNQLAFTNKSILTIPCGYYDRGIFHPMALNFYVNDQKQICVEKFTTDPAARENRSPIRVHYVFNDPSKISAFLSSAFLYQKASDEATPLTKEEQALLKNLKAIFKSQGQITAPQLTPIPTFERFDSLLGHYAQFKGHLSPHPSKTLKIKTAEASSPSIPTSLSGLDVKGMAASDKSLKEADTKTNANIFGQMSTFFSRVKDFFTPQAPAPTEVTQEEADKMILEWEQKTTKEIEKANVAPKSDMWAIMNPWISSQGLNLNSLEAFSITLGIQLHQIEVMITNFDQMSADNKLRLLPLLKSNIEKMKKMINAQFEDVEAFSKLSKTGGWFEDIVKQVANIESSVNRFENEELIKLRNATQQALNHSQVSTKLSIPIVDKAASIKTEAAQSQQRLEPIIKNNNLLLKQLKNEIEIHVKNNTAPDSAQKTFMQLAKQLEDLANLGEWEHVVALSKKIISTLPVPLSKQKMRGEFVSSNLGFWDHISLENLDLWGKTVSEITQCMWEGKLKLQEGHLFPDEKLALFHSQAILIKIGHARINAIKKQYEWGKNLKRAWLRECEIKEQVEQEFQNKLTYSPESLLDLNKKRLKDEEIRDTIRPGVTSRVEKQLNNPTSFNAIEKEHQAAYVALGAEYESIKTSSPHIYEQLIQKKLERLVFDKNRRSDVRSLVQLQEKAAFCKQIKMPLALSKEIVFDGFTGDVEQFFRSILTDSYFILHDPEQNHQFLQLKIFFQSEWSDSKPVRLDVIGVTPREANRGRFFGDFALYFNLFLRTYSEGPQNEENLIKWNLLDPTKDIPEFNTHFSCISRTSQSKTKVEPLPNSIIDLRRHDIMIQCLLQPESTLFLRHPASRAGKNQSEAYIQRNQDQALAITQEMTEEIAAKEKELEAGEKTLKQLTDPIQNEAKRRELNTLKKTIKTLKSNLKREKALGDLYEQDAIERLKKMKRCDIQIGPDADRKSRVIVVAKGVPANASETYLGLCYTPFGGMKNPSNIVDHNNTKPVIGDVPEEFVASALFVGSDMKLREDQRHYPILTDIVQHPKEQGTLMHLQTEWNILANAFMDQQRSVQDHYALSTLVVHDVGDSPSVTRMQLSEYSVVPTSLHEPFDRIFQRDDLLENESYQRLFELAFFKPMMLNAFMQESPNFFIARAKKFKQLIEKNISKGNHKTAAFLMHLGKHVQLCAQNLANQPPPSKESEKMDVQGLAKKDRDEKISAENVYQKIATEFPNYDSRFQVTVYNQAKKQNEAQEVIGYEYLARQLNNKKFDPKYFAMFYLEWFIKEKDPLQAFKNPFIENSVKNCYSLLKSSGSDAGIGMIQKTILTWFKTEFMPLLPPDAVKALEESSTILTKAPLPKLILDSPEYKQVFGSKHLEATCRKVKVGHYVYELEIEDKKFKIELNKDTIIIKQEIPYELSGYPIGWYRFCAVPEEVRFNAEHVIQSCGVWKSEDRSNAIVMLKKPLDCRRSDILQATLDKHSKVIAAQTLTLGKSGKPLKVCQDKTGRDSITQWIHFVDPNAILILTEPKSSKPCEIRILTHDIVLRKEGLRWYVAEGIGKGFTWITDFTLEAVNRNKLQMASHEFAMTVGESLSGCILPLSNGLVEKFVIFPNKVQISELKRAMNPTAVNFIKIDHIATQTPLLEVTVVDNKLKTTFTGYLYLTQLFLAKGDYRKAFHFLNLASEAPWSNSEKEIYEKVLQTLMATSIKTLPEISFRLKLMLVVQRRTQERTQAPLTTRALEDHYHQNMHLVDLHHKYQQEVHNAQIKGIKYEPEYLLSSEDNEEYLKLRLATLRETIANIIKIPQDYSLSSIPQQMGLDINRMQMPDDFLEHAFVTMSDENEQAPPLSQISRLSKDNVLKFLINYISQILVTEYREDGSEIHRFKYPEDFEALLNASISEKDSEMAAQLEFARFLIILVARFKPLIELYFQQEMKKMFSDRTSFNVTQNTLRKENDKLSQRQKQLNQAKRQNSAQFDAKELAEVSSKLISNQAKLKATEKNQESNDKMIQLRCKQFQVTEKELSSLDITQPLMMKNYMAFLRGMKSKFKLLPDLETPNFLVKMFSKILPEDLKEIASSKKEATSERMRKIPELVGHFIKDPFKLTGATFQPLDMSQDLTIPLSRLTKAVQSNKDQLSVDEFQLFNEAIAHIEGESKKTGEEDPLRIKISIDHLLLLLDDTLKGKVYATHKIKMVKHQIFALEKQFRETAQEAEKYKKEKLEASSDQKIQQASSTYVPLKYSSGDKFDANLLLNKFATEEIKIQAASNVNSETILKTLESTEKSVLEKVENEKIAQGLAVASKKISDQTRKTLSEQDISKLNSEIQDRIKFLTNLTRTSNELIIKWARSNEAPESLKKAAQNRDCTNSELFEKVIDLYQKGKIGSPENHEVLNHITNFLLNITEKQQLQLALTNLDNLESMVQKSKVARDFNLVQFQEEYTFLANEIFILIKAGTNHRRYLDQENFLIEPLYSRKFLVTEYRSGVILRPEQIRIIKDIVRNPNSLALLRMGLGKTTYIMPIIVQILSELDMLVFAVVTQELFKMHRESMDQATRNFFKQAGLEFQFNVNDLEFGEAFLAEKYLNLLKAKENRSYIIMTIESKAQIENALTLLMDKIAKLSKDRSCDIQTLSALRKQQMWLIRIKNLFKSDHTLGFKTQLMADEGDEIFDPRKEINQALRSTSGYRSPDRNIVLAALRIIDVIMHKGYDRNIDSENYSGRMPNLHTALIENTQSSLSKDQRGVCEIFIAKLLYSQLPNDLRKEFSIEDWATYLTTPSSEAVQKMLPIEPIIKNLKDSNLKHLIAALKRFLSSTISQSLQKNLDIDMGIRKSDGCVVVPYQNKIERLNTQFGDEFDLILSHVLYYVSKCPSTEFLKDVLVRLPDVDPDQYRELVNYADKCGFGNHLVAFLQKSDAPHAWMHRLYILNRFVFNERIKLNEEQITLNVHDTIHGSNCGVTSGTMNPASLPASFISDPNQAAREVEAETILRIMQGNESVQTVDDNKVLEQLSKYTKDENIKSIINPGVAIGNLNTLEIVRALREKSPHRQYIFIHPDEREPYIWNPGTKSAIKFDAKRDAALVNPNICLFYFDPADYRGTDFVIPLGKNILLTGASTELPVWAQAAFRLRKLGAQVVIPLIIRSVADRICLEQGLKDSSAITSAHIFNDIKKKTLENQALLNFKTQMLKIKGMAFANIRNLLFQDRMEMQQDKYWDLQSDKAVKQMRADTAVQSALFTITRKIMIQSKKPDLDAELISSTLIPVFGKNGKLDLCYKKELENLDRYLKEIAAVQKEITKEFPNCHCEKQFEQINEALKALKDQMTKQQAFDIDNAALKKALPDKISSAMNGSENAFEHVQEEQQQQQQQTQESSKMGALHGDLSILGEKSEYRPISFSHLCYPTNLQPNYDYTVSADEAFNLPELANSHIHLTTNLANLCKSLDKFYGDPIARILIIQPKPAEDGRVFPRQVCLIGLNDFHRSYFNGSDFKMSKIGPKYFGHAVEVSVYSFDNPSGTSESSNLLFTDSSDSNLPNFKDPALLLQIALTRLLMGDGNFSIGEREALKEFLKDENKYRSFIEKIRNRSPHLVPILQKIHSEK